MKLFKILILLIIAPFVLNAQIPGPVTGSPSNRGEVRTFGTRIDVLGITGVTDSTHLIDIRVSDYGRRGYTADSITVNQYLWDQECSRYLIDSVGTVSGSNDELVTVRVLELLGVTTAPIRGPGAVMEEDIYPKIIPGLPQQMQFCIDDFFKNTISTDVDTLSKYLTFDNISVLNSQKSLIRDNQVIRLRSNGHEYRTSTTNLTLYTSSYPSDTSAVIPISGSKWLVIQPDKSGVYPFSAFGGTNNGHNDDDGIAFQKANSFAKARVALGLGRTIIDFEANAFYKIDTTGHIPQLINRVADSSVWRGNGSIIYVVPHEATLTQATYNIFDIQGSTSIEFHDFEFKSTGKFDGVRYLQESGNPNWESNSTRSNIAIFEGNETLSAVIDGTGNKNIVLKNIIFRDIYYPIRLSCSEGCLIENVQIYNPKDGIRAYRTWNSIINNVRVDMDTLPSSNFKTKALYVVDVFNTQLSNFTITGDFNVPIRIDGTEVSVDTCNAVFNNFKLYEVGQTEFSDGAWVANNWTITSPKYEGETAAYLFSFAGGTTSSHPILNNITVDNSNPKMIPIIGTSVSNTNFDLNNFNSTGPIRFATTGASNVGITINNSKINTPWESATYFPNSLFDYDDTGSTGNVRINNLSIITEDEAQNNPRIVEGYGLDITFDKLSIKDEGTTDFIWMFRQEHSSGSISVRNSDFRGVSFDDFASFTGGATEANMPLNNVYLNDGTYILNDVYDAGVKKATDLTGLDGSSSLTETDYLAGYATDATGTNTRMVEIDLTNPFGGSNNIRAIIDSLRENSIDLAKLSFTNNNIDSSLFLNTSKLFDINLNSNSLAISDYVIRLPDISNVDSLILTLRAYRDQELDYDYYVQPFDSTQLYYNGRPIRRYYIDDNEFISVESKDGRWNISNSKEVSNNFDRDKRYSLGDKIGKYVVEGAPLNVKRSTANTDLFYDPSFTIPILNTKETERNYFYDSEDMYAKGADTKWSTTNINVEVDAFNDPFGKKTAEKWEKISASTNTVQASTTFPKILGDYVVSGWVRPGEEAFNDNLGITLDFRSASGTAVAVPIDVDFSLKKWQYFEEILTLTDSLGNADTRLEFRMTGDSADYAYVNRFQVHNGSVASEYKKTSRFQYTESTDTIFAVYYPLNGVLNLGDIYWQDTISDQNKINTAIEYCLETNSCHIIEMSGNLYTTGPINIPPYMSLDGKGYAIHYIGDDDEAVIIDIALHGESGSTALKQSVRNVNIYADRQCKAMIAANEVNQLDLEKVWTFGQDSAQYGRWFYGALVDLASLGTQDKAARIEDCEVAYKIERQNRVLISEGSRLIGNDTAIVSGSGSLSVQNSSIESSRVHDIYATSGGIDLRTVYFENTPDTASSGYRIYIDKAAYLYLDNCYFNGGSGGGTADALIFTDTIPDFSIDNSYFSSSSSYREIYHNTGQTLKWNFGKGNFSNISDGARGKIEKIFTSPNVSQQNRVIDDPVSYHGRLLERFNYSNGSLNDVNIEAAKLGDTIFFSQTVFKGLKRNLFHPDNEDLATGSFTDFEVVGDFDLKFGGTIGVSADSTAELIYATGDIAGSQSYTSLSLSEALEVGQPYCISWYSKVKNLAGGGAPNFIFRTSALTDAVETVYLSAGNTDYEQYWVQFFPGAADSDIDIRVRGFLTNDSIIVSKFQVHKGYFPMPYKQIGSTADQGDLETTIDDSDYTWDIFGNINVLGNIFNVDSTHWQHYFPSNGDTISLESYATRLHLGTNDSVYIDESALTRDALLSVIQSSGMSTVLKADGASNRFYQAGANNNTWKTYGTGSVKTFMYNNSTNHWYIHNDYKEDVTLFTDYSVYQASITPYPNEMIRYDALTSAGTTTISTDNLLQYQKFYLEIVNADTNPVTLDHATGGFIRGIANGDFSPDATETFSGAYHSLILIWDGTDFTIRE